jgi:hypothetical protein
MVEKTKENENNLFSKTCFSLFQKATLSFSGFSAADIPTLGIMAAESIRERLQLQIGVSLGILKRLF